MGALESVSVAAFYVYLGIRARGGLQSAIAGLILALSRFGLVALGNVTFLFQLLNPIPRGLLGTVPLFGTTVAQAQILAGSSAIYNVGLALLSSLMGIGIFLPAAVAASSGDRALLNVR